MRNRQRLRVVWNDSAVRGPVGSDLADWQGWQN
jgi:hypothetical protein